MSYSIYKTFWVSQYPQGVFIRLQSDRIEESIDFMKEENILGLEIIKVSGYPENDISCLKKFDFIKHINIINYSLDDITPIHHLKNLETLIIQTDCNTKIDFTAFPKLKDLRMDWRKNSPSMYDAVQLERLWISAFKPKEKNLSLLSNLKNLTNLRITSSPITNLSGIETMQQLEKLELYYLRNLEDIENTKKLPNLKELCIESCKKIDLKPIANLTQIEKIELIKTADIESVNLFTKLKNLQSLILGETKIIDGNLSPMQSLPKLEAFEGRHYKHYSNVFKELITSKITSEA